MKLILSLLISLALISCSSAEKEAEEILERMRAAYKQGADITTVKPTENLKEVKLRSFERVLSLSQRLETQFSDTLVAQGAASGKLDLGGVTLHELREVKIPRLRRDLLAERDPLTTARVLIDRVTLPSKAAALLVQLARSFDGAGRSREAAAALSDAFALSQKISDNSERVEVLSSIAFGHANASRRAESLEVAFAALAQAKQVSNIEKRSEALAQIALSYYILGVEERGYEALLSISDKSARRAAIIRVSGELLEKNLPHKVLAVSTLLTESDERARFLLESAKDAEARRLAPAVILLVDQALPLVSRTRNAKVRAENMILSAQLLREAGQTQRAIEILAEVRASDSTPELSARLGFELAQLNQKDEALTLVRQALDQSASTLPATKDLVAEWVGKALAAADEPQRALPVLQSISDTKKQIQALTETALIAEKAGSRGFAKQMLNDAERLIENLESNDARIALTTAVGEAYLEIDDLERARALALSLQQTDKHWRSAVRGFQGTLLSRGFFEEALSVTRAVPDPMLRALLLSEAAKQSFKDAGLNEAIALLEEAVSLFDQVKDEGRRMTLVKLVIDASLNIKWPVFARKLVNSHRLDDAPVWFCRVASVFAENGQRDQALAVLEEALQSALPLTLPQDRAHVLLKVGETLAQLETVLEPSGEALLVKLLENTT